jgi:hypothetical protein
LDPFTFWSLKESPKRVTSMVETQQLVDTQHLVVTQDLQKPKYLGSVRVKTQEVQGHHLQGPEHHIGVPIY